MPQRWIHCPLALLFALASANVMATDQAGETGDELIEQIVKLISNQDREFRAAALEQVRTAARGEANTRKFAAQLPKLEPTAQAELIRALADRGDAAARPALLKLLAASKDDEVRSAGLAALGEIGTAEELPTLIKALSARSGAEQHAARTALVRMRGEAVVKALAAEAKSGEAQTRAALIDLLAARRATSETQLFLKAGLDDDARVRGAAMNALGQFAGREQLAAMIPAVLKAQKGGERDAAERNVAAVCARIGNENERADALIGAVNQVDAGKRDDLLSLIGRVGGKRLIDYVGEIAIGADDARRLLAIDALSKWPDASPADKLLEIANKTSDATEREQAFQGYVKISAARDQRSDKERLKRMKQAIEAARTPEEKSLVINRCRTAYDVETVRFVLPYVEQAPFAQIASETIVEIAHHREVREPHKAEFDKALDKVIKVSEDPVVIDRAQRYQRGETWVRPKK